MPSTEECYRNWSESHLKRYIMVSRCIAIY